MKGDPFRWAIFGEALIRKLAYPGAIGGAVWLIGTVASARSGFWAPREYGLLMLAFALSALAVAVIRLADGRFDAEKGRATRRSASAAAAIWLAAFALSGALAFGFSLAERLPDRLPWAGELRRSQCPASTATDAACPAVKKEQ